MSTAFAHKSKAHHKTNQTHATPKDSSLPRCYACVQMDSRARVARRQEGQLLSGESVRWYYCRASHIPMHATPFLFGNRPRIYMRRCGNVAVVDMRTTSALVLATPFLLRYRPGHFPIPIIYLAIERGLRRFGLNPWHGRLRSRNNRSSRGRPGMRQSCRLHSH